MMQRIRQRIRKRPWMVPALLLVLVFAMGLLVEAIRPLGGSATTVGPKWVDSPTAIRYGEALGSSESTRYNGRVWADKTVYDSDVDLDLSGEVNDIILRGDDDFLIGYSLLAATTVVSGQSVVPLDVVFVIDLSLSMEEDEKIEQTVVALNQAVKTLMNGHPDTRIGVVTYSTEAEVLLPLDHYSKVENEDYFSLTVVEGTKALRAHVLDSQGKDFEKASKMSTWTNIHMGIDTGMDLLLKADITTDSGVTRHPALMLMSDGAPTCAGGNESNWWDPQGGDGYGPDGKGEYTLKTIMNASYQKQRVTQRYGIDMQVYTVGVAVDGLNSSVERVTANVTLDPKSGFMRTEALVQNIKSAWLAYADNQEPKLGDYTFTHPDSGDIDSVYYNDGHFVAQDADGISNAFDQVLKEIIVTGAVPTEVGEDPLNSGYITYTDPIGEYMEVKDVKAIVWDNVIYDKDYLTEQTEGNVTTYSFTGCYMSNPVYQREYEFSKISITVTTDPVTKDQTMEVKIPAALIPLRTNTVELNDDGTVASNMCVNDTPLRLFYTVGVRDDVLTAEKKVDLTKIDSEYIKQHTKCGGVLFYSNLYTGNPEDQAGVSKTVGNATVNFVPAATNPFYYNQSDTLVYADPQCTTPARPGASMVYVKVPYYDGTTEAYDVVGRSTSYNPKDLKEGTDGYLYLKAGARCNLSDRIIDKGSGNITQTAETYHYPIYTTDASGAVTGIQLYLGNNGAVKGEPPTGDLTISKTVTGNVGELDRGFVFDIAVYHTDGQNQANLDGTYVATRTGNKERPSTEPSTQPGTGTSVESNVTSGTEPEVSPSAEPTPSQPPIDAECPEPSLNPGEEAIRFVEGKAQVTLSHGESITIQDLPAGYTYVVTEVNPDTEELDYTVTGTQNGQEVKWQEGEALSCIGLIRDGENDQLAYTNKCYVPMVDFSFIKVDGLSFDSTDLDSVITLSGAEFTLYRYTGKSWETDKDILMNPASEYAVWSQVGDLEISDENGVVTFDDLRAGNYRLVEVSAPDGYQLPKGQWNLTVSISGAEGSEVGDFAVEAIGNSAMDAPAMAKVEDNQGNVTYYLMNYKPINPPVTGGDGGEDFRIGGGLLMFTGLVLACWWMWSSPRRRSEFL